MTNAINGDWPAFPVAKDGSQGCGMTYRQWLAGMMLPECSRDYSVSEAANTAVEYTDALIARLNETKPVDAAAINQQLLAACKLVLEEDSVGQVCDEIRNELTAAIRAAEGVA